MLRFFALRAARLIPVVFLVTLGAFLVAEMVPGDPAFLILGETGTQDQYEQIRQELGLNEPLHDRYFSWLTGLLQGDLGTSLLPPVRPVTELIQARLPVTLQIAVMAMVMSLTISVPLALVAAYRAGGRVDRAASAAAYATIAMPSFIIALLLVFFLVFRADSVRWLVLGVGIAIAWQLVRRVINSADARPPGPKLTLYRAMLTLFALLAVGAGVLLVFNFPDFPRVGFSRITSQDGFVDNLRFAFLPALALAINEVAGDLRLLRGDLITTLQEDYILAARAKGTPDWQIMLRDALRPSSFSLVTTAGLSFARLIGGTVIIESIFGLPGMGTLLIDAVSRQDLRVVQGCVLVIALCFVVANLLVDVSYNYLDPRLRRGRV